MATDRAPPNKQPWPLARELRLGLGAAGSAAGLTGRPPGALGKGLGRSKPLVSAVSASEALGTGWPGTQESLSYESGSLRSRQERRRKPSPDSTGRTLPPGQNH